MTSRVLACGLTALLAITAIAPQAFAPPKPATVPFRWELQFKPGDLRLYLDPEDERVYWYMSYKVTNRVGRQLVWAPSFTLFTDAGEILPSGRDVPFRVAEDLLALLGNPLLEDQNEIIGDILVGKEHAKEGLVIWPADRLDVNQINLFVAGISGETARVRNPMTGEQLVLRKTLEREYLIRGSIHARWLKPLEAIEDRWVMR
jgi:hypothetical protein